MMIKYDMSEFEPPPQHTHNVSTILRGRRREGEDIGGRREDLAPSLI
jgi:hypothetical protein